jgi:hypothetical protein
MWRFKRSFLDPKNGNIRLYYIKPDSNTAILDSTFDCMDDTFPGVPKDVQKDARARIKILKTEFRK